MDILLSGGKFYLKGRVIGVLRNNTLVLERYSKVHFFKKYQGYGANHEMLLKCQELGISAILLIEHHSQGVSYYSSTVAQYLSHPPVQEGDFEPQNVIKLKELAKVEA